MDTCPSASEPESETHPTTHERPLDTRQPVTSIIAIVLLATLGAAYLMRAWFHTSDRLNAVGEDMYALEIAGFLTRGFIPVVVGFLCAIVLFFAKEAARVGVLAVAGALLFAEVDALPTNFTYFLMHKGVTQLAYLIVDLAIVALAIAVGVLLSLGPVSQWLRAHRKTRRGYADSGVYSTEDSTPPIRPGWIVIVVMLLGLIALAHIGYSVFWIATSTGGSSPASVNSFAISQIVIILSIVVAAVLSFLGVAAGRTLAIAVSGYAIFGALVWLGSFMTMPPADVVADPADSAIMGFLAADYTVSAAAGIVTLVLLGGRQCVDWFYVKESSKPVRTLTQTSTPS